MTDDQSAGHGESGPPTDEADPEATAWPPSNYPILLAILLLVGTAVALVIASEEAANRLATVAYYALLIGVALRIIEHVAGDRLQNNLLEVYEKARNAIHAILHRE